MSTIISATQSWTRIATAGSNVKVTRRDGGQGFLMLALSTGSPDQTGVGGVQMPAQNIAISLSLAADLWLRGSGTLALEVGTAGAATDIGIAIFGATQVPSVTLTASGNSDPVPCGTGNTVAVSTSSSSNAKQFQIQRTLDNIFAPGYDPTQGNWVMEFSNYAVAPLSGIKQISGAVTAVRLQATFSGPTPTGSITLQVSA